MASAKIVPTLAMPTASERPTTAETKEAPKADGKAPVGTGDDGTGKKLKKEEEEATKAKTGKPKGAKSNVLLSAKHEPYADDSTSYKPRLTPEIRREYWDAIVAQRESKKPEGFRSWAQAYYTPDIVISDFPSPLVRIFYVVRSKFWDELYLNLLLIYLLLYVFIVDGYAAQFAPFVVTYGDSLLQLPLAFMFITQLFSLIFSGLFLCWCNDLVLFMARYNFGDWGFCCVIICQFLEKYLYSGVGRADQAGQCAWIMKKFFSKKEEFKEVGSSDVDGPKEGDIEQGTMRDGAGGLLSGTDTFQETFQEIKDQDKEEADNFLAESQKMLEDADKDADILVIRPKTADGKGDVSGGGGMSLNRPGTSDNNKSRPGTSDNSKSRPGTSGGDSSQPHSAVNVKGENRPGTGGQEKKSSRPNTGKESEGGGDNDDDEADGEGEEGEEGDEDGDEDEDEEEGDGDVGGDESSVLTAGSGGSKSKGGQSKGSKGLKGKRKKGMREIKKKKKKLKIVYVEWKCFVCLKENKKPRFPSHITGPQADIYFGTKGEVFKRTYAIIKPRRDIPLCDKCFAPMDYKPPNATAKMFENYPDRWIAFAQYPKKPPGNVQAGLGEDAVSIAQASSKSFFYGLHDSVNSGLMSNDWKLKKYVAGIMPLMPRPVLKPGGFYELSEIVECRLQKSDWARCRIIAVRSNHTYDIKYDPGDELRFVFEDQIRLPPEKHLYAFITELSMMFLVVTMPLALLSSMMNSVNQFVFPILFVTLWLLAFRIYRFISYFRTFYQAGCFKIFQMTLIYILPLIFLFLACAVVGGSTEKSGSYESAITLFTLACVSALLPLYMMRPTFALLGVVILPQVIVGAYFVATWLARTPAVPTLAYTLAPFFTAVLSAKYVRANLHAFWDVSLVMRPNAGVNGESFLIKIKKIIFDALGL